MRLLPDAKWRLHRAAQMPATPQPSGRLIVFLIQRNLAKGYARGLMHMLEQSRTVIRGLAPEDRVAILSFDTSLAIWTDFTNDRAVLDHIFERGVLHERPPPACGPFAPSFAIGLNSQTAHSASTIERALELIARAVEPLPGAKVIAFISHGMGRIDLIGTTSSAGSEEARSALIDARASVFSLDFTPADSHSLAFGLQKVASETGGFYAQSLDFPERPCSGSIPPSLDATSSSWTRCYVGQNISAVMFCPQLCGAAA
jgi:hypothetical protein